MKEMVSGTACVCFIVTGTFFGVFAAVGVRLQKDGKRSPFPGQRVETPLKWDAFPLERAFAEEVRDVVKGIDGAELPFKSHWTVDAALVT
jgi:hypothetical protein